MAFAHVYSTIK